MNKLQTCLHIMKRELYFTYVKDRRRGILLILAATTYLLLFSLLYQHGSINEIPTIIYDQNQTALSRSLINEIDSSDKFHVSYYAESEEDMLYMMRSHRNWISFQIPSHFERDVKQGKGSPVLMTIDGANLVLTSTSSLSGIEIVKNFSNAQGQKVLENILNQLPFKAHTQIAPIDISYYILGNPTLNYLYFLVLGLSLAAFQQGVLLSVAASFLHKEQVPTQEEKSLPPLITVLVKIFPYWASSILSLSLLLLLSNVFLNIPFFGHSYWPLYLLIGSFATCLCGISATLAQIISSELTFTRISVIYTVPAFILTGFTWPLLGFTPWTRFLAWCSPLTYVANTFRDYYLLGKAPMIYTYSMYLFLIGVLFLGIASLLYSRNQKDK